MTEIETETLTSMNDKLKDAIIESLLSRNEDFVSLIQSYAYVSIQRLIYHCKQKGVDPLKMSTDQLHHFANTALEKELK